MDASSSEISKGKRATVPKHGKKPENRLWSRTRRGYGVKESEGDGTINPDASIMVAAVCGSEVRIYEKSKRVRKLSNVIDFANHGQAAIFATEHDEAGRRARASSRDESARVYAPFYQVKVGGTVIEHTNNREKAHAELRAGAAMPKELWRVSEGGQAELLERIAA